MSSFKSLVALLLLVSFSLYTQALKHDLVVQNDKRASFYIENFGFEELGTLIFEVKNFKVEPAITDKPESEINIGFVILETETSGNHILEREPCILAKEKEGKNEGDTFAFKFSDFDNSEGHYEKTIEITGRPGFYNTYFVNCEAGTAVSFELKLTQFNPGEHYLSIGEAPLPMMYLIMATVYVGALVSWITIYLRGGEGRKVLSIHYLMTFLLVLKVFSLAFKGLELHYKNITGEPGRWDIVYYFFQLCKGTMLFVIIALIGTGWSFLKPFLNDREKKIFMIVIPLQILDNIALIIVEETAPGSQSWFTWSGILRAVDIICCLAILAPIIWSINFLKEASSTDGKAARNMEKLKLFRQFYLVLVTYLYFTRFIVYLLDATLPFRWTWLGEFFTEAATLLFYCTGGYQFRPVVENPYLRMPEDVELTEVVQPAAV